MLDTHLEYRIICIDKLTYAGNLSTLASLLDPATPDYDAAKASRFRFCKVDICDRETVERVFEEEKPNVVVNFAAESHVDRSIENPGIFPETNIMGTQVMMDACRRRSLRMELRRSFSGIWSTGTGGRRSFPESTRSIMRGCMGRCNITISIPDEVLHHTQMSSSETEDFVRKAVAFRYYTKAGVSLGYCAEIAGVSQGDFIRFLGENGISIFQTDSEEEFLEDTQGYSQLSIIIVL